MSLHHASAPADDPDLAHEILARLGDRWSVLVIHMIEDDAIRFTDLKRKIDKARPISARALTRALKQLERDGLVARKAFPVVPPRVEYSLTPLGHRFLELARTIMDWTQAYRVDLEAARRGLGAEAPQPFPSAA
jgi:DNA-binding HxlR family transcriptional regulator